MSTRLSTGREWNNRIKVDGGEEAPMLDPKHPIQAAVMGRVVRDINNGNFDSIGNLQVTAKAFNVKGNESKVVIGRETVTFMQDNNKTIHEVTDADLVKVYLDNGMTIIKTETRDIMG
tara:strand:- start:524 stop:877 length:354 start_codon:yes stop_codon:yes gene_type:complete